MKILQICTKVPYPPNDGGAAAVYALSKSFHELGHEVDVLAINPKKHFIPSTQLAKLPFTIHTVEINTNATWIGALLNLVFSKTAYHNKRFISNDFKNKLIELLTGKKYDMIQIEGVYLCSYVSVIRKYSTAKISLRAHNVEHLLWHDIAQNEQHLLKKLYFKIQTARLKNYEVRQLSLVDAVVAISEPDASVLKSLHNSIQTITIPFGVKNTQLEEDSKQTIDTIFYIGALDWIPNQESLLWFLENIWPAVSAIFPNIKFHLAGRNAPKWLINKIKGLKQVVFYGEVENSAKFMKTNDLMVVPLFSGSGMRVKIIEAMNLQKIIVATEKACIGIPVQNGKHLRIANTANEFIAAITTAINMPETNRSLIKESKSLVIEKFDNFALASKLVDFYRRMLP